MMNRDDYVELLEKKIKKEKTTDLSNKDDLASDMLGNQILSSIDSSHQAVHSNDYFTSNTSPNLSSSSHDNAQTNFNSGKRSIRYLYSYQEYKPSKTTLPFFNASLISGSKNFA